MNNTPTNQDKATPSELALKIALALYPNGLPNVSYCWDTPEKNEASRQADRNWKALEIDRVLQPEHAALKAVAEASEALRACRRAVDSEAWSTTWDDYDKALANLNALRNTKE